MKKLFTLIALACMALVAQAQGKYALVAGSGDITAGKTVTDVENITMTFGYAGEVDYKSPVPSSEINGYTAYTEGNGVNGKADENSGTAYFFQPQKKGELTVAVYINVAKPFYVLENDIALSNFNGVVIGGTGWTGKTYTFPVVAGKTYKVTCHGSKLGFYGFEYTVSADQGGDTPVVIPTNSENYSAIVDGKLAPEFAAIAGEDGGVANNTADGKSIITIQAGKATVTAVGGTMPANNTVLGGAAQQITPGAPIEGKENTYEVASVEAWNDVKWERKNQGDIDFWYVLGTGNPYVDMLCVQNSKDDDLIDGSYKADYVFYEPDGSLGMPITGLYYKFTASAQGAFKVKVWANKGNRKTFVVNANTMKAERLYASGYINAVNDNAGKKKLLTVEQVDSVHNDWIWENYNKKLKANEEAQASGQELPYTEEQLAEEKAIAENNAEEYKYVIGHGNKPFWGWLTFDVEAGEEYWVFQHSSQIGFGGFEFHEGITAEELIQGIEAAYVYTTNFSTYEDEETGERVTWKGEKAVGNGQFASEEPEVDENGKPLTTVLFGDFFRNDGSAARTSYCLLPEDVLAHSANSQGLTLAVWVRAQEAAANYLEAPIFAAYQEAGANGAPLFASFTDGTMKLDNGTQYEYSDAQVNDWLADKNWHYYTAVFKGESAQLYIDGELKKEWDCGGSQAGLFSNGAALKYICLGGNAPSGANDAPFDFARLLIKNSSMSAGEVKAQMAADAPGYQPGTQPVVVKGDANGDGKVDVEDVVAIVNKILNEPDDNFNEAAADVSGDGKIDVDDVVATVNIILGEY